MKNFLIPVLLFSFIFLWWCSQNQATGQQPIVNTMTADQLFQKKKECASYRDEIQKDIDKNYWLESDRANLHLTEIFYSSKRNSCLYVVYAIVKWWSKMEDIYDYFTKEDIFSFMSQSDWTQSEWWQRQADFDQQLKELKWE